MTKRKLKIIKQKRHQEYVKRKTFYRKFGRKYSILLTKDERNQRKKPLNKSLKRVKKIKGEKDNVTYIILPEVLSLDEPYREEFLKVIEELKEYLPSSNKSFIIDHSMIARIDPEALLILVAEIKRSTSFRTSSRMLKFLKRYAPKNKEVKAMLSSIGYWEHFNIPKRVSFNNGKEYFKIVHDIKADNQHIVDIRDFFKDKLHFLNNNTDIEEAFDNAITEAIANSVEHAYIKNPSKYFIKGGWWLAGFYNKEENELFFGCYDQGIGVARGMKNNDKRAIKLLYMMFLKTKPESEVIDYLIHKPLPKYKKEDRGYGFKEFIKLIEKYKFGSLAVHSNKGCCKITQKDTIKCNILSDSKTSINGTLIVWKIKLDKGKNNDIL